MTKLVFDTPSERKFETGVSQGVLYPINTGTGLYDNGVAWNGLTAVNEKPGGATQNKQYADNIVYANITSLETFSATIQAFMYPDEFGPCDGNVSPEPGVFVGQQGRQLFGMSYRTEVGTAIDPEAGYKLHLAYGLLASPSEKDYSTINDSPAPIDFSWDADSTPVPATSLKPVSLLVFDSTQVDATALSALEDLLYGTSGTSPSLPLPDVALALFAGTITAVTLTVPTFDGAHTITIPTETGVTYYVDGVEHAGGSQLLTTGQKKVVSATANAGYRFNTPVVTEWLYSFVS